MMMMMMMMMMMIIIIIIILIIILIMCLRGTRSRQGRRANVQENDLEIDEGLARLT